jgi:hypothetical protein
MNASVVLEDTRQEERDDTDNGVRPTTSYREDSVEEFL